jgi:hypothetical protein
MAKRSREHRSEIPGYDEARPSRDDRKLKHRADRHATHQILHALEDPEEVVLPEHRRTAHKQPVPAMAGATPTPPERQRFRVWKTKFWKRRGNYRSEKAALDAEWPVVTPDEVEPG